MSRATPGMLLELSASFQGQPTGPAQAASQAVGQVSQASTNVAYQWNTGCGGLAADLPNRFAATAHPAEAFRQPFLEVLQLLGLATVSSAATSVTAAQSTMLALLLCFNAAMCPAGQCCPEHMAPRHSQSLSCRRH
jgi:hypothetical protein